MEVVGVGGAWQNLAMTRGLEATNGYNPLRIGWYDRLVSPGETTYLVDQRQFPASFDGYDCALARELGLEYVVLGRPIEEVPHLARRPIADILLAGPRIWIYRLADPEPRVQVHQSGAGGQHQRRGQGGPLPRHSDRGDRAHRSRTPRLGATTCSATVRATTPRSYRGGPTW